jgi:hypothetical protein
LTVFRQSDNRFYFQYSINNSFQSYPFGSGTGDNHLTSHSSDFDGDGRLDPLLLKLNQTTGVASWSILSTLNNSISTIDFGNFLTANNEALAMADYDGDGKEDIAVFRRGTGVWYIRQSSTGTLRAVSDWGQPQLPGQPNTADNPSVGDYDGDGSADLCVIRTVNGQRVWFIRQSSNGQTRVIPWGSSATDSFFFFANVDVDGDGKQDLMVTRDPRPAAADTGDQVTFLVLRSSDNGQFFLSFGLDTDTRLLGDYDGDGKTDFASRRNVGGILTWYIALSSNNWNTAQPRVVQFGQNLDTFAPEEESNDFPVESGVDSGIKY